MVNSGQFWPTTKRYFEHYIWKARAKTEPNGFVQNHLICKWTCVSSRRKLICWVDALAEHRIKRDLGATFHLVSKWRHKEGKNRGKFPKHNYFYCYFYLQQPLATAWGSEYMLLLAWVTNMMRMMMIYDEVSVCLCVTKNHHFLKLSMCNDVQWCVMMCDNVRWCVMMCDNMQWCVMMCDDVWCWCAIMCYQQFPIRAERRRRKVRRW